MRAHKRNFRDYTPIARSTHVVGSAAGDTISVEAAQTTGVELAVAENATIMAGADIDTLNTCGRRPLLSPRLCGGPRGRILFFKYLDGVLHEYPHPSTFAAAVNLVAFATCPR